MKNCCRKEEITSGPVEPGVIGSEDFSHFQARSFLGLNPDVVF